MNAQTQWLERPNDHIHGWPLAVQRSTSSRAACIPCCYGVKNLRCPGHVYLLPDDGAVSCRLPRWLSGDQLQKNDPEAVDVHEVQLCSVSGIQENNFSKRTVVSSVKSSSVMVCNQTLWILCATLYGIEKPRMGYI
jgi:hypothetical protein